MKKLLAVLVLGVLTACGSDSSTGPDAPQLQVTAVEVVVLSSPAQATARVTAQFPSVCTVTDRTSQRRTGNVVEVTITTRTTSDVCVLIYPPPTTIDVRLDGAFPSGDYVVRVNGVDRAFRT